MPDFDLESRQLQIFSVILLLLGVIAGIRTYMKGTTDFMKITYLPCASDEDCVPVPDACSCVCGGAINKNALEKYNKNSDKICKDFFAAECSLNCAEVETKCRWGKCRLMSGE